MQRRPSVLIADDHPLVSHGLRELLRSTHTVVGTVGDGREVHAAVERTKPDVLLLDLSMPHRNGLDLIPELVAAFPALRILVVTMHLDRTLADLALQGGAHGFIPKGATAEELNGAIRDVLSGERYISPKIPRRSFRDGAALEDPSLDRLTPRQRQILELIGQGKSSGQIAESLSVSPRTIEFTGRRSERRSGSRTRWDCYGTRSCWGRITENPAAWAVSFSYGYRVRS